MSKAFVVTLITLGTVSGVIIGGIKFSEGYADSFNPDPVVVQTVKHQGEVLDNHEVRLTNAEDNIKDLQDVTGTPPSTKVVEVPRVSDPAPTVDTPVIIPITIVSSGITLGDGDHYCSVKYSDGTSIKMKATTEVTKNTDESYSMSDNCSTFLGQVKQ